MQETEYAGITSSAWSQKKFLLHFRAITCREIKVEVIGNIDKD